MRIIFSTLFLLTISNSFANDKQYIPIQHDLSVVSFKTITPSKDIKQKVDTFVLKTLPQPTENKHQFRYLFKRVC